MEGFKEVFQSSSIHGVGHILSEKKLFKVLWIFVVLSGFIGAGMIISQSFQSWEDSPVSTTIETSSISDLAFPEVVVCPAKNSFTTLNPDLIGADKKSWDENTTRRLQELLTEATFDLNEESKYNVMTSFFEKEKFFNWYKGESKLWFPSVKSAVKKEFFPKTSAVSGTFSTPHFGEKFSAEDFDLELMFHLSIYVPKEIRKNGSISLVIDVDYDIEENLLTRLAEFLKVYGSEADFYDREQLNATFKKYRREFPLKGDDYYIVAYTRDMYESDYHLWKSKRHIGMRVSWHYNDTVQPDQKYLSDNKEFISLVNAVHENRTGLREELMRERHDILDDHPHCYVGRLSGLYGHVQLPTSLANVSDQPIYTDKLTQETLDTAGRLYFYFREGIIQISVPTALKSVHNQPKVSTKEI